MKRVAADELKLNLDAVLSSSQDERIVISRRGKPCAVLVGIEDYDSDDLVLASSDQFWRMIRARRASGKSIPLEEIEARFKTRGRKPARKQIKSKKARSRM